MKNNKKCKILLLFAIMMIAFIICSVCYAESEKITENLEISASVHDENGNREYGSWIKRNEKNIMIYVKASDYGLPSNLYEYKDDILLRITYSEGDEYKVYDCKVISKRTNDIIEDLSEENLNKLFNIEYKKEIIEKEWTSNVKLLELEENVIYKYTTTDEDINTMISFINNTGKNCFIYIKKSDSWENEYERYTEVIKRIPFPYQGIQSVNVLSANSGYTVNMMYRIIDDKELVNYVDKKYISYISEYKIGEKLELKPIFGKNGYIYNDTQKNITLNTVYSKDGNEQSKLNTIKKGEIYEIDIAVNSISFVDENSVTDNTEEEQADKENDKASNYNDNSLENNDNTIIKNSKFSNEEILIIGITICLGFIIAVSAIIINVIKFKDIK